MAHLPFTEQTTCLWLCYFPASFQKTFFQNLFALNPLFNPQLHIFAWWRPNVSFFSKNDSQKVFIPTFSQNTFSSLEKWCWVRCVSHCKLTGTYMQVTLNTLALNGKEEELGCWHPRYLCQSWKFTFIFCFIAHQKGNKLGLNFISESGIAS